MVRLNHYDVQHDDLRFLQIWRRWQELLKIVIRWQNLVKIDEFLGQILAKFTKIGKIWSKSGKIWSKSTKIWWNLPKFDEIFDQNLPEFGNFWWNFARFWWNLARFWPNFAKISPNFATGWQFSAIPATGLIFAKNRLLHTDVFCPCS